MLNYTIYLSNESVNMIIEYIHDNKLNENDIVNMTSIIKDEELIDKLKCIIIIFINILYRS